MCSLGTKANFHVLVTTRTWLHLCWLKKHVRCRFYTPPTYDPKTGATHANTSVAVPVWMQCSLFKQRFISGCNWRHHVGKRCTTATSGPPHFSPHSEEAITRFCEHDFSNSESLDFACQGSAHHGGMRLCLCPLHAEKHALLKKKKRFHCIGRCKKKIDIRILAAVAERIVKHRCDWNVVFLLLFSLHFHYSENKSNVSTFNKLPLTFMFFPL